MRTSIAMTTYNGSKYIMELLDSILNQIEQPDEVVIVDDCSTDNTYDLVNKYIIEKGLDNWYSFRNTENKGWRENFREVFKRCCGDLIFLCDQDDVWMPQKILEMKNVMISRPEIQLLVSNYSVMNIDREEKIQIDGLDRDDGLLQQLKFKESSLTVMRPGCTFCARKSLIDKLWNRDMITTPHDAMLWGYAAIEEALFLYNRKLIEFRRHTESASTPNVELSRSRRIKEISLDTDLVTFFLEECQRNGDVRKEVIIEKQLQFYKERKKILEEKLLLKMLLFQIRNHKKYATIRNMLSDDYVLLLKRS